MDIIEYTHKTLWKSLVRCSTCGKTTKDPNAKCWKQEPPLCGKCDYEAHPERYSRKITGSGGTYTKPARSSLVELITTITPTITPKSN